MILILVAAAKREVGRVQEGFTKGIFNDEEAKGKIDKLRGVIKMAEAEIGKLSSRSNNSLVDTNALKQELVVEKWESRQCKF